MERDCEERLEAMIRWQKFVPMSFDSPWRRSLPRERKGRPCEWRPSCEPSVPCVRSMRLWWWKVWAVCMCRSPRHLTISDIIYRMKIPVIVVGQSGLGGINHALLTLHALRRRKIPIVALVLNRPRPLRTKTARSAGTIDRDSASTACGGSRGGPPPLQSERESKLERRPGPPRGDRSDHEAGEVGPSPHYS